MAPPGVNTGASGLSCFAAGVPSGVPSSPVPAFRFLLDAASICALSSAIFLAMSSFSFLALAVFCCCSMVAFFFSASISAVDFLATGVVP